MFRRTASLSKLGPAKASHSSSKDEDRVEAKQQGKKGSRLRRRKSNLCKHKQKQRDECKRLHQKRRDQNQQHGRVTLLQLQRDGPLGA